MSHLLQADTCPLDQSLQSGDSLVLPQQEGVEGWSQVTITLVRDHIDRSERPVLGLAVARGHISLWGHAEGHEDLWDLLDQFELVGKLGQLFWQFDEMIINVYKTQVRLKEKREWIKMSNLMHNNANMLIIYSFIFERFSYNTSCQWDLMMTLTILCTVVLLYLLWQLQLGAVILSIRVEAHQIWNRSIQEMEEGGRQNGNIHVLPLEGEH